MLTVVLVPVRLLTMPVVPATLGPMAAVYTKQAVRCVQMGSTPLLGRLLARSVVLVNTARWGVSALRVPMEHTVLLPLPIVPAALLGHTAPERGGVPVQRVRMGNTARSGRAAVWIVRLGSTVLTTDYVNYARMGRMQ